ncbi:MAG: hypothetical protein WKF37_09270 [Bryobacteraceae bacterium]
MSWWQRLSKPKLELSGVPSVRRVKTYSAESGYVYQYAFRGFRDLGAALEYVFEVSSGRGGFTSVAVFLKQSVLQEWANRHQRSLGASDVSVSPR